MNRIEKAFREYVQDTGEHRPIDSLDSWGGQWEGYEAGYNQGVEDKRHELELVKVRIQNLEYDLKRAEFNLDAFGGWLIEKKAPSSVLEEFRKARNAR